MAAKEEGDMQKFIWFAGEIADEEKNLIKSLVIM